MLDAILSEQEPALPSPLPLEGLRLAVPQTLVQDEIEDYVATTFAGTLTSLSEAGAQIKDIDFSELSEIPRINAHGGIYAEAYAVHRRQLETSERHYDPRVASRILRVSGLSAADYYDVLRAREDLIERANRVTAAFDAIILPTTAMVAPAIADLETDEKLYSGNNILMLRNTFCFNFLDRCALSIPMHQEGDAPAGLMVVGETMGDGRLLSIGRAIETILRV
jgi:aspartyl-tRNA(Asn)/glutamyl-tRNA(Gln) amidotransferase subunit A